MTAQLAITVLASLVAVGTLMVGVSELRAQRRLRRAEYLLDFMNRFLSDAEFLECLVIHHQNLS